MLEAVIHQHLPIFHTEHCVFARFLSEGNSFIDCGKPCEHHSVSNEEEDERGREIRVIYTRKDYDKLLPLL